MRINDDAVDDGGINMILAAFAIWSLMKRKFSRVVSVAVGIGICVRQLNYLLAIVL